ncbi:hypothetical protein XENTR_v10010852 [Xenopus tropicalis]|nr:hypothetical protein XENTR_v10010852 [Xenopus tropicalis]
MAYGLLNTASEDTSVLSSRIPTIFQFKTKDNGLFIHFKVNTVRRKNTGKLFFTHIQFYWTRMLCSCSCHMNNRFCRREICAGDLSFTVIH